jgi:hypothetical protein
MIPPCLYQSCGRSNPQLDTFIFLCNYLQEASTQNRYYLPPNNVRRTFLSCGVSYSILPSVHLASVSAARAALAPSSVTASVGKYKQEQVDHPIFNGRPFERRGPPVVIYNEPLANLKHELHNLAGAPEPSDEYVALTAELFHASATIYDNEDQRGKQVYGYLERLLGTSLDRSIKARAEKSNRKTTEADAVVRGLIEHECFGNEAAVLAYVELKNELGIRGDGGLQAALSLRKYVAQEHVKLLVPLGSPRY